MLTKYEIISKLGRKRAVETLLENIVHKSLNADLQDLAQMVYLILLEYDESKLQDLWNNNEMHFFIVAIIKNQYFSETSTFYRTFKKYQIKSEDITGKDWSDDSRE